jgi:hypothetical protein
MSRKLTRRQLAAAITAPLALAGTPAASDLQAAQENVRKSGEKLTQYKLTESIEPALHFKA